MGGDKRMCDVNFVPATEQDAMAIIELRRIIWGTTYRGIYPDSVIDEFDYAWHQDKELQRIKHPRFAVYLISKNGCNIGYRTLRKTEIITLQSLYIIEDYQHQGIGKCAFEFIVKYCRENQQNSFVCQCVPENKNARMFYEKMGGKIVGEDMGNKEHWMNSVIYRFDF